MCCLLCSYNFDALNHCYTEQRGRLSVRPLNHKLAPNSSMNRCYVSIFASSLQVYGAAIQFYESFCRELLSERQSIRLGLLSVVDRRPITNRSLQVKKSICVLSHWPFFTVFQKFLTFVYRYSISGPHVLPIEKSVNRLLSRSEAFTPASDR